MTENTLKTSLAVAGAVAAMGNSGEAAQAAAVGEFIASIKSQDDNVRGTAWQGAGPQGAAAVKPLAAVMAEADMEIARAAKRALYKIVRQAGRSGAGREARAVAKELKELLPVSSTVVRRDVLWMLSEIGEEDAVTPMAALLTDKEVREDARCALMRMPGRRVTTVLKSAFASAPEDFKSALAESLRRRGEKLNGYPSQKLVPTRETKVTAVPAK